MTLLALSPTDSSITNAEEKLIEAYETNNAIIQKYLNDEEKLENYTINALGVVGIISGIVAYLLFKNEIDMPAAKYATSVLGFGLTGVAGIGKLMK